MRRFVSLRTVILLALLFAVLGMGRDTQAQSASKDRAVSQDIKLKNGITLNYVVQGAPKGPVVVLLHGAGDSWHSYERVLPLLPASYRVYAVTLRGHGLSDHPDTGYSRADFAEDILDFIEQLKLEHVTLVGHSLGSLVAQKVAEQDPGHLDRLVLIGSGPGTRKAGSSEQTVTSPFAMLKDPVPYTFARNFQASTIYRPVPAWFFETMVGESQRVPAATWHGIGSNLSSSSSVDDLKKIKVPTLLCWGDHDSIFHRDDQQVLLDTIPHATLKVYPGTGHALHWEEPEHFTRDLLMFIRGGVKKS